MSSETVAVGRFTVRVKEDPDPLNPREKCDNLGAMICLHHKWALGDKHYYREGDFESWDELEARILKENPGAVILPLFLFDHGGLAMMTGPEQFRAQDAVGWDWGQVGFIYVGGEAIRAEYGAKRISRKLRRRVEDLLQAEVEEYDRYLRGEAYLYEVVGASGEVVDSCGGFDRESDALAEGLGSAEAMMQAA